MGGIPGKRVQDTNISAQNFIQQKIMDTYFITENELHNNIPIGSHFKHNLTEL